MAVSNSIDNLSDIVRKLQEAISGIEEVKSEAEEWKNRAIFAESLNKRLIEKNQKSEHTINMWKNRATRAEDLSDKPLTEERNPPEIAGSRARPSSRLTPRTLSPQRDGDRTNSNFDTYLTKLDMSKDDDDLLDFDGGDSCTFLVSDQEESLTTSDILNVKENRRRNIKGNRPSVNVNAKNKSTSRPSSKRLSEKKKLSPSYGSESSDDDSSVEAMNILNGYLELRGQYDTGRKSSRRERTFG